MSARARVVAWAAGMVALAMVAAALWLRYSAPVHVARGIFWQVESAKLPPRGVWNQIGVQRLVVQYGFVDGKAWFANSYTDAFAKRPDWLRIRHAFWARGIVMGLAGDYSEPKARTHLDSLARLSSLIYRDSPVPVAAYYFPIEANPGWLHTNRMKKALRGLPRPLWVSVYSRRPVRPRRFARWVAQWLPNDVGVLVQDGVGLGDRTPGQALSLLHALQRRLGRDRVGLIAEAFKKRADGTLAPAPTLRLIRQLTTYKDSRVYLYDVDHLPAWQVWFIKLWFKVV